MNHSVGPCDRLILDLDFSDMDFAINLIDKFSLYINSTMINSNTIYSKMSGLLSSPWKDLETRLREIWTLKKVVGQKVFLDLNINGTPDKVGEISKDISKLNPRMFSVDILSGKKSIAEAVANKGMSKVFGSLKTHLQEDEYFSFFGTSSDAIIGRCGRMLVDSGADGIVCSCLQARILRQYVEFKNLLIACPINITCQNEDLRINPRELTGLGIDYLIIGKPIINSFAEIYGLTKFFDIITKQIALGLKDRESLNEAQHVL